MTAKLSKVRGMAHDFLKTSAFSYIMITVGAVLASFALEEFLIPSTILDGGVTGVSTRSSYKKE